jgi:hypothetical protein
MVVGQSSPQGRGLGPCRRPFIVITGFVYRVKDSPMLKPITYR